MGMIDLHRVQLKDSIFGNYTRLLAEKILPYQWQTLSDQEPDAEKTYCIENFRIVAGQLKGRHGGAIFQDTDLYKWLEAVAFCITAGYREKLEPLADQVIELIVAAQGEDGYLNTYITIEHPQRRWQNLIEGHELYSAGHLIEAAVAYYQSTGKRSLLDVGIRFADLIDSVFGTSEGKLRGYPGHQEIELALVKLYRVTNEPRYLKLAEYFISERGKKPNFLMEARKHLKPFGFEIFPAFAEYDELYAQIHDLPVNQKTAEGHAVRALYMYSAMADVALETGDEKLAKACDALYQNITERRMYITGGVGSSGKLERFTTDYDLPNDTMYAESCASVALMMFAQRMARLRGEATYYDTVERALMNTVLGGIAVSGDRYFYVNPLEVWPQNCLPSTSMSHVVPVRQKWFTCACCPPNIARTLASVGQYIFDVQGKTLLVNQFISSTCTQTIGGVDVTVDIKSTYMQDGRVTLTVTLDKDADVTLKVRVPHYLRNAKYLLDMQINQPTLHKGYTCWSFVKAGCYTLEIQADVPAQFVAANLNVRADAGKVALMKGPFVYCLEETDNGADLANLYACMADGIAEGTMLENMPGELPTLNIMGKRIIQSTKDNNALYDAADIRFEQQALKAVPYYLWCNREPGEMKVWLPIAD